MRLPAILLMGLATIVSTLVSFAGGLVMYISGLDAIIDTVRTTSKAEVESVSISLSASFKVTEQTSEHYRNLFSTWRGLNTYGEYLTWMQKEQLAVLNARTDLYSVLHAIVPETNTLYRDDGAYYITWFDPLKDGGREWLATSICPSNCTDAPPASTPLGSQPEKCPNAGPGYDRWCDTAYAVDNNTGDILYKVYDYVLNAALQVGDVGTAFKDQQEGWETKGATWWRRPTMWASSDNTPYLFASHHLVLPRLPASVPVLGGGKKVLIISYFTFSPWGTILKERSGIHSEQILTATYLDRGILSVVVGDSVAGNLLKDASCFSPNVNLTEIDPCSYKIMNLPAKQREGILMVNNTAEGEFITADIPGGAHWLRRGTIQKFGPKDLMPDVHLVWMQSVASVEGKIQSSLYLFVGFVCIVFAFDAGILVFEVVFIAKPLVQLERTMAPLETMDIDGVEALMEPSKFACTVKEMGILQLRFAEAVAALREYRRFLPRSVLVHSSDEDEIVTSPGSENGMNPLWKNRKLSRSARSGSTLSGDGLLQKPRRARVLALEEFRLRKASFLLASLFIKSARKANPTHDIDSPLQTLFTWVAGLLDTCGAYDAVTVSKGITGDRMEILFSWNALKAYGSHAPRASEAAIAVASEQMGEATEQLAVSSGTVCIGNVGNDFERATAVFGRPVVESTLMVSLARRLGTPILCSRAAYEQARSLVSARVVDVVMTKDGEESLVYELIGKGAEDGNDLAELMAKGFSELREGHRDRAKETMSQLLQRYGYDAQAVRFLKLASLPGEHYVRPEQDIWPDMEAAAGEVALPAGVGPPRERADKVHPAPPRDDKGETEKNKLQDKLSRECARMPISNLSEGLVVPDVFQDARGRSYHRSERSLGTGAFGMVWLGMGADGAMVAVKSIPIQVSELGDVSYATIKIMPGAIADAWTMGGKDLPLSSMAISSGDGSGGSSYEPQQTETTTEETVGATSAAKGVEEMLREVDLMTNLRHDNIVQFLGCGVESGHVLIVMEYLPGGSLQSILRQFNGKVPESCVRRFTRDILSGLRFIHSQCIVHRDLKPANVLLTIEGQCKLADFGASAELKTLSNQTEEEKVIVGTPMYMAPEQTKGTATTGSDIWSLGIIVCELHSGEPPWPAEVRNQSMMVFIGRLGTSPETRPEIPIMSRSATELVNKCLQHEAADRPSARALLNHEYVLV
eukprot:Hpha_TRINITY_DN16062_c0_g2::TRINITY_DN16062_c0_g2_i1::g.121834::m.121834